MMATQTVKLKIHEESDLFTELDPDQRIMSEDVVSYLTDCFQQVHKKDGEDYVIHIDSDTPVDHESVKQRVQEHFRREKETVKNSLKKLSLKAACLAVFGVVVLSIWFYLSKDSESVNLEVLSIVGWVAIWEATSVTIMGRHDLNVSKKIIDKMLKARIVISDQNDRG